MGFLINPVAGMGGAVGLKGTDRLVAEARKRGARPVSPDRAKAALEALRGLGPEILFFTASGEMGERVLRESGFEYQVVYQAPEDTGAEDSRTTCKAFLDRKVDLIVFCGGDGTARDVTSAAEDMPILGIPAGVKMHSGVFAISPEAAADLIEGYLHGELRLRETEIVDVDEEMYRSGILEARLYGLARTPYKPALVQERKQIYRSDNEEEFKDQIAIFASEFMRDGSAYIIGAGTTTSKIGAVLGIKKTLLGVDVVRGGKLICKDASEKDLLNILDEVEKAMVIISPIGAQGFVLGRGSQQISPKVLRRVGPDNLIIVATPHKLRDTPYLLVDTGDPELDKMLSGRRQVVTGYRMAQLKQVMATSEVVLVLK
ncbi:MAG: ATP-NAD kinase family protein [Methanotrichaceae archaeon]